MFTRNYVMYGKIGNTILVFIFLATFGFSQNQKRVPLQLEKIGFQISQLNEKNFLFDDPDYFLKGTTIKFQLFYPLKDLGNWDFNLIVQPQVQLLQHRLDNPFFIQPNDYPNNFLELRERLVQKRNMSLYALELGFQLRRQLLKNIFFEFTAGLGLAYIDTETERLASGFTFTEGLSIGLAKAFTGCEIYVGGSLNHISNFNLQNPNSGYNLLGWELSFRFL